MRISRRKRSTPIVLVTVGLSSLIATARPCWTIPRQKDGRHPAPAHLPLERVATRVPTEAAPELLVGSGVTVPQLHLAQLHSAPAPFRSAPHCHSSTRRARLRRSRSRYSRARSPFCPATTPRRTPTAWHGSSSTDSARPGATRVGRVHSQDRCSSALQSALRSGPPPCSGHACAGAGPLRQHVELVGRQRAEHSRSMTDHEHPGAVGAAIDGPARAGPRPGALEGGGRATEVGVPEDQDDDVEGDRERSRERHRLDPRPPGRRRCARKM